MRKNKNQQKEAGIGPFISLYLSLCGEAPSIADSSIDSFSLLIKKSLQSENMFKTCLNG